MMEISLIVAMDSNQGIGKNNDLMWHLPKDMNFFKTTTEHQVVIMGRKNFESIPHKYRPLPNRTNVVVTRQNTYQAEGCIVVNSIEDAIKKAENASDTEPFIIGGGEIYQLALKKQLINRIYLTRIHHHYNGDTFFPTLGQEWKLLNSKKHLADEKHIYDYDFEIYEK